MKSEDYLTIEQVTTIARLASNLSPRIGIYGVKAKDVFSLEGEECEWRITQAFDCKSGKEGIALTHSIWYEDAEQWVDEEPMFLWFPSNWHYGGGDKHNLIFKS